MKAGSVSVPHADAAGPEGDGTAPASTEGEATRPGGGGPACEAGTTPNGTEGKTVLFVGLEGNAVGSRGPKGEGERPRGPKVEAAPLGAPASECEDAGVDEEAGTVCGADVVVDCDRPDGVKTDGSCCRCRLAAATSSAVGSRGAIASTARRPAERKRKAKNKLYSNCE